MRQGVKRQYRGAFESIAGRFRRAFGVLLGHDRDVVQGRAQELEGEAKIRQGAAAERVGGKAEEVGGAFQRTVGQAVGSERLAVEGRAKELEGRDRQEANR